MVGVHHFEVNLQSITVVEGDLLDQDVDVIVNTWNRNIIPWWLLPHGRCVSDLAA